MDKSIIDKNPAPLGWDKLFDDPIMAIFMGQDTYEYYQGFDQIKLVLGGKPLGKDLKPVVETGASNIKPAKKLAKKKKSS